MIPVFLRQGPARVSNRGPFMLDYTIHPEINGQTLVTSIGSMRAFLPIAPSWPGPATPNPYRQEFLYLRAPAVQNLPDGPHQFIVEFRVAVRSRVTVDRSAPPLAEFKIRQPRDWILVPPGSPTVQVIKDLAAQADAQKKIRVTSVVHNAGLRSVTVTLTAAGLAFPVAAEVTLRAGDRTWPAGDVSLRPPLTTATLAATARSAQTFDPASVDVILRPSAGAARKTPDINRVWDGEVVIPNVPVTRRGP